MVHSVSFTVHLEQLESRFGNISRNWTKNSWPCVLVKCTFHSSHFSLLLFSNMRVTQVTLILYPLPIFEWNAPLCQATEHWGNDECNCSPNHLHEESSRTPLTRFLRLPSLPFPPLSRLPGNVFTLTSLLSTPSVHFYQLLIALTRRAKVKRKIFT